MTFKFDSKIFLIHRLPLTQLPHCCDLCVCEREEKKWQNQKLSSDIVRLHNELRYLCEFNTIYLLSKGNENEIY